MHWEGLEDSSVHAGLSRGGSTRQKQNPPPCHKKRVGLSAKRGAISETTSAWGRLALRGGFRLPAVSTASTGLLIGLSALAVR